MLHFFFIAKQYSTVCTYHILFFLLIDLWIVFTLWQLWIKLLWTFSYSYFCKYRKSTEQFVLIAWCRSQGPWVTREDKARSSVGPGMSASSLSLRLLPSYQTAPVLLGSAYVTPSPLPLPLCSTHRLTIGGFTSMA